MFILADCMGTEIPTQLTGIIAMVVNFMYIGIPILLIIWGMLDLGKAIIAQKEDDIKKGQSAFIKRLIAGAIVFLVVFIVKFLVRVVAGDNSDSITSCIDQILSGR